VGAALMAPQGLAIIIGCLGSVAVVFVDVRCQRAVRIFAASRICADHDLHRPLSIWSVMVSRRLALHSLCSKLRHYLRR
jgi:hypothetical protein